MKTPFKTKSPSKKLSFDILTIMQKKETKGDIGLEIEVEGNKFPKASEDIPSVWCFHEDHSLRGMDNAEYVLRNPLSFDDVPKALNDLAICLKQYGSVMDDSNRTSVHVHLNVQRFHLKRLCAFMALYFCFEEILTEWCGDHRVGNLFCLRAKDAPGIVSFAKRFLKNDAGIEISDHYHYAGFNMNAIKKFGSIEIRTLRGVSDFDVANNWVLILRRLYELSDTYNDPRDVISSFSAIGPSQYFEEIFGFDLTTVIRSGISWNEDQIRESLYDGIRFAQDICYCRDWSLLSELELRDDPFGRTKKQTMHGLATIAQQSPAAPSPVMITHANPMPDEWGDTPDFNSEYNDEPEFYDED